MSSAKLQGNINGTGTITIQTPNTNSNSTQNLPDVSGTILVAGPVAVASTAPIYENTKTVSTNYTITSGSNAHSVGPITIAAGVTVTIPAGSRWVIN